VIVDIDQLIAKSRSFRRFDGSRAIEKATVLQLIDLARKSPSGANRQPLKFHVSVDKGLNERIYPTLAWAGYLQDWEGPIESERPTAYVTILLDKEISQSAGVDHGIAAWSILLGATARGLGGCMIASIRKKELAAVLELDQNRFDILLVVALGKPVEQVMLEDIGTDGEIRYWRDNEDVHHVPKRRLDDITIG
jgi:nitroreductase